MHSCWAHTIRPELVICSLGSCWAFGVTGLIEAAYFIRNKELIKLSEQHLIDGNNLRNFGCKHGSCSEALDYIMRNDGIINAESYPYKEAQGPVRSITVHNSTSPPHLFRVSVYDKSVRLRKKWSDVGWSSLQLYRAQDS
jgi:hypothetical protein